MGPEGGVDVGFLFEPAAEVDAVGFEGAPVEVGVGEGEAEGSEKPVHVYCSVLCPSDGRSNS